MITLSHLMALHFKTDGKPAREPYKAREIILSDPAKTAASSGIIMNTSIHHTAHQKKQSQSSH